MTWIILLEEKAMCSVKSLKHSDLFVKATIHGATLLLATVVTWL